MNNSVLLQSHPQFSEVAIIELNRPEHMNGLTLQLAEAFYQALQTVSESPQHRLVLIRGRGKCFMAGGDLQYFQKQIAQKPHQDAPAIDGKIFKYINRAVLLMHNMPQIIICQVHGAVAGIGLSFMLAADLAIGSDNAIFNMAYSNIGISPDGGISWQLPRILGTQAAMAMALLSPTFDAARALELKLLNFVYAHDELELKSDLLLTKLLAKSQSSMLATKQLIRNAMRNDLPTQLTQEANIFCAQSASLDFSEGVTAFLERRQPQFNKNN